MQLKNQFALRKSKILIYADVPGWAFHHILMTVKDEFNESFDIYFDYTKFHRYKSQYAWAWRLRNDLMSLVKLFLGVFISRFRSNIKFLFLFNYRLTFFWTKKVFYKGKYWDRRVLPFWRKYDVVILLDYYFDRYAKLTFRTNKLVKGIYTDSFPPLGCNFDYVSKSNPLLIDDIKAFAKMYLSNVDALIAGSPLIKNRYSSVVSNVHFCNAVQRPDLFVEKRHSYKDVNDQFVIGWTGNPNREFKNFHTIVVPAVEGLRKRGLNVILKTRFNGPYETLPEFYKELDIVIIASTADAGPSMFAEAALSGVPAVSNRIGFADYVVEQNINGMLVDLDIPSYEMALQTLYFDRALLFQMSKRIRSDFLAKMSNEKLIANWRLMFASLENSRV